MIGVICTLGVDTEEAGNYMALRWLLETLGRLGGLAPGE